MTCTPSALAGMSQPQLQAALAVAQAALVELMTGRRGVTFNYAQGDGAKAVTYQVTSQQDLRAFIAELQRALGLQVGRRRPLRMIYR